MLKIEAVWVFDNIKVVLRDYVEPVDPKAEIYREVVELNVLDVLEIRKRKEIGGNNGQKNII